MILEMLYIKQQTIPYWLIKFYGGQKFINSKRQEMTDTMKKLGAAISP